MVTLHLPVRARDFYPDMDARGIDVEVLSINPFWYWVDRDLAFRLITAQNEGLAEVCAAYPDRFVGLATVALQHPDLAAEQLEEGVKTLALRGGSVGASVGSEELASRRFDPFWAKAPRSWTCLSSSIRRACRNWKDGCRATACSAT